MREYQDDKIQTGLRIPRRRYEELKEIAERSGASVNAIILYLVDIGLSVVSLGSEEFRRSELRNQQHNGEQ